MEEQKKLDNALFWPVLIGVFIVAAAAVLFPEGSSAVMNNLFNITMNKVGWLYLWIGFFGFLFLMWLAFGKYGSIKLGGEDDKPQFNLFSWSAMIICSGISSTIMYWGTIEFAYYIKTPPMGAEPHSPEALEWASTYGMFHWGFTAWSIFVLAAIPIAYAFYVKKTPSLRMSIACKGILGKYTDGPLGKFIDMFMLFGQLCGMGTALALTTPMISAGACKIFGLDPSYGLNVAIIFITTCIFGTSVYLGLEKGIKRLSDFNWYIAFGILAFVLIVGPTSFILGTFTNSIGVLLEHLPRMSLWTDPIVKDGFPEGWTMFYWAWWIAPAPYIGLFITKISKGRTIKEVILGVSFLGAGGCWLVFAVMGNYGLYCEMNDIVPVTKILTESGAPAAIVAIVSSLPFGTFILSIFILVALTFMATSMDSTAYVLAAVTTKNLGLDGEPRRLHRIIWAFILVAMPISLMFLGGLKTVQTITVVGAVPLTFILLLMVASLMKWLRSDTSLHSPEDEDKQAGRSAIASALSVGIVSKN
ncbi:MAG: BCCT family transporter [Desulfobacterales bacterium]|nr:BCCT family transporter [Desulfobacterales bacterium]